MNIKHITLHEGTNKGPVIDLVLSIKSEINKSSVINRPGTIEFAKNVCQILLKLDLR